MGQSQLPGCRLAGAQQVADLPVREAILLGLQQQLPGHALTAGGGGGGENTRTHDDDTRSQTLGRSASVCLFQLGLGDMAKISDHNILQVIQYIDIDMHHDVACFLVIHSIDYKINVVKPILSYIYSCVNEKLE